MKRRQLVVLVTVLGAIVETAAFATESRESPTLSRSGSRAFPGEPSERAAADTCVFFFRDYGDAPEGFPAYPSVTGRFPTCSDGGPPGTQEIECESASSTPPGTTWSIVHIVGFDVGFPFWLGCGAHPSQNDAGDGESSAKTSAGSATSACGSVAVDCFETSIPGMSFGQDECLGDSDAGVSDPLTFESCASATFRFRTTVCPNQPFVAYLNVLVDWNQDGDWNDNVACASSSPCVREWALKNQTVALQPGCSEHTTPSFRVGPRQGTAWMRVTLTSGPVPESFPWAGSFETVNGDFAGGETEDYLVTIGPSAVDVSAAPNSVGPALVARPNPFHESCAIRFVLTRPGPVRVDILDIAGRRVRSLVSDTRPAGDHALTWDGTDDLAAAVPNGVYVVRLEAEHRTVTRRLVMTR